MKFMYKLSLIAMLVITTVSFVWYMRKRKVEKFAEKRDTDSIIASFSERVNKMLMRQAMEDDDVLDDETSENNSA